MEASNWKNQDEKEDNTSLLQLSQGGGDEKLTTDDSFCSSSPSWDHNSHYQEEEEEKLPPVDQIVVGETDEKQKVTDDDSCFDLMDIVRDRATITNGNDEAVAAVDEKEHKEIRDRHLDFGVAPLPPPPSKKISTGSVDDKKTMEEGHISVGFLAQARNFEHECKVLHNNLHSITVAAASPTTTTLMSSPGDRGPTIPKFYYSNSSADPGGFGCASYYPEGAEQITNKSSKTTTNILSSQEQELLSIGIGGVIIGPSPAAPTALHRENPVRGTFTRVVPGAYAEVGRISGMVNNSQPERSSEVIAAASLPATTTNTTRNTELPDNNNNNLTEAIPVEEDHMESPPPQCPQAQPYDAEAADIRARQNSKQDRCVATAVVWMVLVFVVMITLVVAFVPNWGGSSKDSSPSSSSSPPSSPPTEEMPLEIYILSLLPSYTQESIGMDPTSPQSRAYDWVVADPNLLTYSEERIIQRFSLSTLFYSTNGEEWWNNTNWLSYQIHECMWETQNLYQAVEIAFGGNESGVPEEYINLMLPPDREEPVKSYPCEDPITLQQYTHLWLLENGLSGDLPPEIFLLTSLKTLALTSYGLTGQLSSEIGKLSSLEYVAISYTEVSGTVPTEVGVLESLKALWLYDNQLSGTIPTEFGRLSDNLRALDLGDNHFTGSIPASLKDLRESQLLALELNSLTGTIPMFSSLGERMLFFMMRDNQLSGHIPTELGKLTDSKWLDLGDNQLTGLIPSELGLLQSVQELKLDSNRLIGSVPETLSALVTIGKAELFHIYSNSLTGVLQDDLCLIDTVSDYNNNLVGCNCTCSFKNMYYTDLEMCSPLPNRCA